MSLQVGELLAVSHLFDSFHQDGRLTPGSEALLDRGRSPVHAALVLPSDWRLAASLPAAFRFGGALGHGIPPWRVTRVARA